MDNAGQLCPCGSGLRATRCCEAPAALFAPNAAGWRLDGLVAEAQKSAAEGRSEAALRLLRDVLDLAPGRGDALLPLARLLKAKGEARPAEVLLRRLIGLDPNHIEATQELALMLFERGALAEAENIARNAMRIAPHHPQSHNLLGMIFTEANRAWLGEYHYRRALALRHERDPILLANLAWSLKNQGRAAPARALYEEALRANPNEIKTLLGWAALEEADRDFPRALALLDQAEALAPGSAAVRLARATCLERAGRADAALALLDAGEAASLGATEWSQKGRLLDRLGRHSAAFAAFTAGKARARAQGAPTYLATVAEDLARRLRGFFTSERLATLPRPAPGGEGAQPLFILGFPRSGTTLIEQILTSHPDIAGGDELPFINDLAQSLPRLLDSTLAYPEALAELWMADRRDGLSLLRESYLRAARLAGVPGEGAAGSAARWFTDKMPLNETHLGLIALLFPESPLIHLIRHPLDVVLSVFSNHLTHGYYCAAELETIARHYVRVMDLVRQYRGQMTLRYLPLRYEEVVAAPEASVRRLLAFIGAGFDPACLAFHENRRHARTASYAQVTEPLYDRSLGRYRHYLAELAPVIPILAPLIERLGYQIEGAAPRPTPSPARAAAPGTDAVSPEEVLSDEAAASLLKEAGEHEQAGRFPAAEAALSGLLRARPDHPHANHLMGVIDYRAGRIEAALARMERSLTLAPANPLYPRNLCEVYRAAGRHEEALRTGLRAVEMAPEDPLALGNLGIIHYSRLEITEALACAERALARLPDHANAHFLRAEALLLSGDWAAGWEEYEWRFRLPGAARSLPETDEPAWDGAPLPDGRLLLVADQGFGDAIQFCRYIPWAAARAKEIVVACSREIMPLMAQFPAVRQVVDRWEACGRFDAYAALSGLPRLHGTRPGTIPADIPYLAADPARVEHWRERLARLLPAGLARIGLAWAGRPSHNNDRYRSMRLSTLAPLAAVPGVALVALQKGAAMAEIGDDRGPAPLLSLGPALGDFAETMAVLDNLDLVITVDTALGHLAGAMGKPVWIMLPFAPDWRWRATGTTTAWYPSVRLFRQDWRRQWPALVEDVAAALGDHFGLA